MALSNPHGQQANAATAIRQAQTCDQKSKLNDAEILAKLIFSQSIGSGRHRLSLQLRWRFHEYAANPVTSPAIG